MKKAKWTGKELVKVVKGNVLGEHNLSVALKQMYAEYGISPKGKGTRGLQEISREVYLVQCKDWNRFIYLYGISISFDNWPQTLPKSSHGEEYVTFQTEMVEPGIKKGSLVTSVVPMQASPAANERTVRFQVLGRVFYASGSSVVKMPRNERKAFRKAENILLKVYQKRGSLKKLQEEEISMMTDLISNHPRLQGLSPINIFKVDEDAYERVEKVPFDLTV